MCGIFLAVSTRTPIWPSEQHQRLLQARGPDYCGRAEVRTKSSGTEHEDLYCTFYSTVLSLRGNHVVGQPLHDTASDSRLCWNGEAWTIGRASTTGNDTDSIFALLNQQLQNKTSKSLTLREELATLAESLSAVAGPYAFAYFNGMTKSLYFGRDFLGRRSLLWRVNADGDLLIASVSDPANLDPSLPWTEIAADGLYGISLVGGCHNMQAAGDPICAWGTWRIRRTPYKIQDKTSPSVRKYPCGGTVSGSLVAHTSSFTLTDSSPSVLRLEELLRYSLTLRITNIPNPPWNTCFNADEKTKLAILFSGGLDCTTLARMCHDILPPDQPIDLLNVAFENPRVHKANNALDCYELCPDRITGRASHEELQQVCDGRLWRFVAINVPFTETLAHRAEVLTLMHPHNTEMDLSIAYALYFAARGQGMVAGDSHVTTARVLLSGLGADEVFGGYQRHATAFKRGGLPALVDELSLDVGRLGSRNLGRDDRVMSHWGKEVRFPYLDESFLGWAIDAPVFDKCGFGEPVDASPDIVSQDGAHLDPAKKVLRCLAWRLDMRIVANEKKRAIQFGARTAKMEAGKTKGTQLIS